MSATWKVCAVFQLSTSENSGKSISVKEFVEKQRFFIDIRKFFKNKPTKNGVCLTTEEFDWISSILLYNKTDKKAEELENSYRIIKLLPRISGGYDIIKEVDDARKSISLNETETNHLIKKIGEVMEIIKRMKKKQDKKRNDEDSPPNEATYKGAPLFGHSQRKVPDLVTIDD